MTISNDPSGTPATEPDAARRGLLHPARRRRTATAALTGAALLAIGAGAGAAGWSALQPEPATFDPALGATPVAQLNEGERVELQGRVAEIFGNKFVLEDATGRALVETGRRGEGGQLVAAGETVTVQGRFEKGSLRAGSLQRADGAVEELRPAPPPRPPHERP
ncbi:hypothetical protein [Antarcticirhabdus aurantiaca]|uniref:Uncharacterized protein n=1 Tax=Antarcticirhabdus aurantiaca TaxID=2606717 RepID=A0ACD4NM24_9HYPH|nr:hypothetical protein [Antarcticirhabdus aurantiaca]WAJ27823.1 hypothetical protein OXU80_23750 [Jeongeuplla avenae]